MGLQNKIVETCREERAAKTLISEKCRKKKATGDCQSSLINWR
jgi:hypothetical protein